MSPADWRTSRMLNSLTKSVKSRISEVYAGADGLQRCTVVSCACNGACLGSEGGNMEKEIIRTKE